MPAEIAVLYAEYAKFVYNIAYRMLNNKNDAEDVLQEVFIKLLGKIGSFKGSSSIKTFIYRMTVNQCIDLIRRQQSLSRKAEKSWAPKTAGASDDSLLLDYLLSKLNEKQRAVVLLYEIAGCSQKEISEAMNISRGTVKSILSRSIAKMAAFLEKEN